MNSVGMDALSMFQQLSYNIFNSYKPNPKTWEMYFDAEASTKALNVALKMSKALDREPEIIAPIYIHTWGRAA